MLNPTKHIVSFFSRVLFTAARSNFFHSCWLSRIQVWVFEESLLIKANEEKWIFGSVFPYSVNVHPSALFSLCRNIEIQAYVEETTDIIGCIHDWNDSCLLWKNISMLVVICYPENRVLPYEDKLCVFSDRYFTGVMDVEYLLCCLSAACLSSFWRIHRRTLVSFFSTDVCDYRVNERKRME